MLLTKLYLSIPWNYQEISLDYKKDFKLICRNGMSNTGCKQPLIRRNAMSVSRAIATHAVYWKRYHFSRKCYVSFEIDRHNSLEKVIKCLHDFTICITSSCCLLMYTVGDMRFTNVCVRRFRLHLVAFCLFCQ